MIRSAILSLVAAVTIYWYPSYETYKVIARRSANEAETEKWLIYWCVVGAFAAFESSVEWFVHWIIFYYEIKVFLLVFIAQGGAGAIYHGFLSRKYAQYEPEIDRHVEDIKSRAMEYFHERVQDVYGAIIGAARPGQGQQGQGQAQGKNATYGEMANQLWGAYGGAVLAKGTKILNSGSGPGSGLATGTNPAETTTFTSAMAATTMTTTMATSTTSGPGAVSNGGGVPVAPLTNSSLGAGSVEKARRSPSPSPS